MILYPAIDLKDGQCVRLKQGDYKQVTVFNDNPAAQAKTFETQGFRWIHAVDLNGALEGAPVNIPSVKAILKEVTIPVQLGGGIRSIERIEQWLEAGISRVIMGTVAIRNPQLVKNACQLFPGQIAVSIDGHGGKVAVEGWTRKSEVKVEDLALEFEDAGACAIIYTDIDRDGMMKGPNIDGIRALAEKISTPLIASGGMSGMDDISAIKELEADGVEGVILGRALYDGKIDIPAALKLAESY